MSDPQPPGDLGRAPKSRSRFRRRAKRGGNSRAHANAPAQDPDSDVERLRAALTASYIENERLEGRLGELAEEVGYLRGQQLRLVEMLQRLTQIERGPDGVDRPQLDDDAIKNYARAAFTELTQQSKELGDRIVADARSRADEITESSHEELRTVREEVAKLEEYHRTMEASIRAALTRFEDGLLDLAPLGGARTRARSIRGHEGALTALAATPPAAPDEPAADELEKIEELVQQELAPYLTPETVFGAEPVDPIDALGTHADSPTAWVTVRVDVFDATDLPTLTQIEAVIAEIAGIADVFLAHVGETDAELRVIAPADLALGAQLAERLAGEVTQRSTTHIEVRLPQAGWAAS